MANYVKVDIRGVEQKLSVNNLKRGRYAMMNQILADVQPFIPYKLGDLSTVGMIGADDKTLVWESPYAKPQYYGIIKNDYGYFPINHYTTPGTGPYWIDKAKARNGKSWASAYVEGLNL